MKAIYFLVFLLAFIFADSASAQTSRDSENVEAASGKSTRKNKIFSGSGKNYQKQFNNRRKKEHRRLARKALKVETNHLKSQKKRGSDGDIQTKDVVAIGDWRGGDIKSQSKYNHKQKEKGESRLFKKKNKPSRRGIPEREDSFSK